MEQLRKKDEQLANLAETVNKLEQQVLELTKQLKKGDKLPCELILFLMYFCLDQSEKIMLLLFNG